MMHKLMEAASSLFDGAEDIDIDTEYARGVCELIARACPIPDVPTYERTKDIADELNIRISP